MSAQWAPPDFLDALKTQLEAVVGLAGIPVHTALPGPDTDSSDRIILGSEDIAGTTPWGALGLLRRDDTFTVPAEIQIVRPGAGETVAKAARDQVEVIFELVLEALKTPPTVGDQTLKVDDIAYTLIQGVHDGASAGRAAVLKFRFTVTCKVT